MLCYHADFSIDFWLNSTCWSPPERQTQPYGAIRCNTRVLFSFSLSLLCFGRIAVMTPCYFFSFLLSFLVLPADTLWKLFFLRCGVNSKRIISYLSVFTFVLNLVLKNILMSEQTIIKTIFIHENLSFSSTVFYYYSNGQQESSQGVWLKSSSLLKWKWAIFVSLLFSDKVPQLMQSEVLKSKTTEEEPERGCLWLLFYLGNSYWWKSSPDSLSSMKPSWFAGVRGQRFLLCTPGRFLVFTLCCNYGIGFLSLSPSFSKVQLSLIQLSSIISQCPDDSITRFHLFLFQISSFWLSKVDRLIKPLYLLTLVFEQKWISQNLLIHLIKFCYIHKRWKYFVSLEFCCI